MAPRGETWESRPLTVSLRDCQSAGEGQQGLVGRQRHAVFWLADTAESEPAITRESEKMRILVVLVVLTGVRRITCLVLDTDASSPEGNSHIYTRHGTCDKALAKPRIR